MSFPTPFWGGNPNPWNNRAENNQGQDQNPPPFFGLNGQGGPAPSANGGQWQKENNGQEAPGCTCSPADHEKLLERYTTTNRIFGSIAMGFKILGLLFFCLCIFYATKDLQQSDLQKIVRDGKHGTFMGVTAIVCFAILGYLIIDATRRFNRLKAEHGFGNLQNSWPPLLSSPWLQLLFIVLTSGFLGVSAGRWTKASNIINKGIIVLPTNTTANMTAPLTVSSSVTGLLSTATLSFSSEI